MTLDLFAGIAVGDYEAAKPWYGRLLGVEPSFIAHATSTRASRTSPRAGSNRTNAPHIQAKARKAIYRDADGNEIGFGGAIRRKPTG